MLRDISQGVRGLSVSEPRDASQRAEGYPPARGRTTVRTAKVRKGKAKEKSKRGLLVLRIKRRGTEELTPDLLVGIHEALDPLEDTPQPLQVAWVLDKRGRG